MVIDKGFQSSLRDFRLSGVQLEGQAREDYARISEELAQTSQQFSEHVLDAIDQWHYLVTDQAELDGIPDDVLAAAQRAAQENDQQGWRLTLKMPCYLPVMQYARNQTLRELMYRAYTTIASDQGDTQFDNSQAIETLLNLRAQEASLLGFASYAHMRLETRMADTPEQAHAIASYFGMVTDMFLRLIKMIIAPLVFSTLVVGIAKMGDIATVGRVGGKALSWFIERYGKEEE